MVKQITSFKSIYFIWLYYVTSLCNSLISSCRAIRPLLLSLKSTWASLYFVITSTNFLARIACWGERKCKGWLITDCFNSSNMRHKTYEGQIFPWSLKAILEIYNLKQSSCFVVFLSGGCPTHSRAPRTEQSKLLFPVYKDSFKLPPEWLKAALIYTSSCLLLINLCESSLSNWKKYTKMAG